MRDPYPGNIIPADDPCGAGSRRSTRPSWCTRTGRACRTTWPATRRATRPGSWTRATSSFAWTTHFSPKFKATFSGYYNNRPSVRNCGGAQGCTVAERPAERLRRRTRTTSARASPSASTRRTPTPQWDWIINNNLMSHSVVAWDRWYMGGASLSAGANWPQRMWGSQQQSGLVLGDAGPPRMAFAGNIPYNTVGSGLAGLRVREERSLAVLHRPGLGPGQEHGQGGLRVPAPRSTRTRGWAVGGAAGNFDFNRLETGGYDAAGNNLSQTGDPFASFLLGQVHDANQSIYAQPTWYENYLSPWVNAEFKVNSKLTRERGAAPGLPDRPHRGERRVLDVRSEHAEPGRGRPARGRDLRGRRSGSYGNADVREPEVGRLGTAGGVLLSRQRQDHDPRRVRDVLRAGWRSPSSPATRTSGSRRTRSRRT